MATTIKFDGVEIATTTYIPRFVKHESVANREIGSLPIAREDGDAFIWERYGQKVITVQGILTGTTQANMEANLDIFTELFSRPQKNLDVDWNGGTRRYVATCKSHSFDRDHFNNLFVPWTAEFVVLSGEGKATSTTTPAGANATTVQFDGVDYIPDGSTAFTIEGSKSPKPVSTIANIDAGSLVQGIEYKNLDTGERLIATYPGSWGNDRSVVIDFLNKTVQTDAVDGIMKDAQFDGVFPTFEIGTNNFQIIGGGIINQKSTDDEVADLVSSDLLSSTTRYWGQGFQVPKTNATFAAITLGLKKAGAPGTLTWRIETDNAGKPSGSLAHANATGTIAAANVSTSFSYVSSNGGGSFSLTGGTTYWLVVKAAATLDGSNRYDLGHVAAGLYPRGRLRLSDDSGGTWAYPGAHEISFRILYGGGTGASFAFLHTVVYYKTFL